MLFMGSYRQIRLKRVCDYDVSLEQKTDNFLFCFYYSKEILLLQNGFVHSALNVFVRLKVKKKITLFFFLSKHYKIGQKRHHCKTYFHSYKKKSFCT